MIIFPVTSIDRPCEVCDVVTDLNLGLYLLLRIIGIEIF